LLVLTSSTFLLGLVCIPAFGIPLGLSRLLLLLILFGELHRPSTLPPQPASRSLLLGLPFPSANRIAEPLAIASQGHRLAAVAAQAVLGHQAEMLVH
jgi:hypothetical protein